MSESNAGLKLVNLKPATPLKKSIYGTNLANPVIPLKCLDSTRLEEPGGGGSGAGELGVVTKRLCHSQSSRTQHTYAGVVKKGQQLKLRLPELPIIPGTTAPTGTEVAPRALIKRKKGNKPHLPLNEGASKKYNERYQPPTKTPRQTKHNPTAGDQFNQEFFSKRPRRKKGRASSFQSTYLSAPEGFVGATQEPMCNSAFLDALRHTSSDNLGIWWRILGFAKLRQGPIKVSKYIKALEAVGFKPRNRSGSHVTFHAPTEFKDSHQGCKHSCLTLHIPHGANIEDIEVRDKATAIKEKYPIMVNTMYKVWKETRM
ncbi:hypothetical protein RSAG8_11360, partial [Rhizoctonia solani AG-8 WAC10335]